MGKELELAIKIAGKVDKSLGSAVASAQSQLNSMAKAANVVGAGITTAVVTAGAKLVVESTQQAISYEKAMAGVAKVVDDCRDANGNLTETYRELYNGILDMSTEIPMTANDISSIVESAGQAGIAKDELLDFAESAAKMGIAFDTTAEQAGDWMAQWRTSMGLTQSEVETLADQINYLGNTSSEKATKLSEVVSRVGALGKIAGLSGGQVAAIAAAMPGVEAEVAATGIKNMTKAMTKGEAVTKKQQGVLDKLGFSATELADRMQTDAEGAILDLLGSIKQLPEAEQSAALSQYFGNESVSAIAPLLSNLDNLKEQFGKVGDSSKYAGSMQTEYEAAAATTANKIELLKNKISKEMIELGNQITPILSESIDKISDKIPELADIIGEAIEKIIPIATSAFEYLIDNSDKIISGAIGIAKAFAGIKIASGTIKGIDSIVTLGKNLNTLKKAVGGGTVLKGIIGTFTGVSTSAGTAGGAITGALAGIASGALPVLGVLGAIAAVGATAYTVWDRTTNHWADGVEKASTSAVKYAGKIQQLNSYQKELGDLELVINSSESSTEEINTAKQRIEEIAALLAEEYGLTIHTDDTNLDETLGKVQEVVKGLSKAEHSNFESSAKDYISEADKAFKDYDKARNNIGAYQNNVDTLDAKTGTYKGLKDDLFLADSLYDLNGSVQDYQTSVRAALSELDKNGLKSEFEKIVSENSSLSQYGLQNLETADFSNIDTLRAFTTAMQSVWTEAENEYNSAQKQLTSAEKNISKYETATDNALNSMAQVLQSDILNGNTEYIQSDIELFNTLYKHLNDVGVSTDGVVEKYALAKNGFSEVTEEVTANDEAINNIIADMKSFGDMQGMFDGLNADGAADKLSDMAHAMGLIPENKSITIDAQGNFSVIEEAENQIASLKSQGDVDVSVNANGDITVYNEATQQAETLNAIGAVSLQVNADGNIDVLDKAQEKIATVNQKTGKVTLGATDNASPTIQQATDNANKFGALIPKPTLSVTDNASSKISTVERRLSDLDGKIANTTIVTEYKTKGTPPGENAMGTNSWRGGLTYVNDQNISDPREVIEYGNRRWWYEGRNVLTDLPRGARIYNALQSRAFINGSHRDGLDRVPFDGYIAELHQGEQVLTADEASDYSGGTFGDLLDRLKEMLDELRGGGNPRGGDTGDSGGSKIVFSPQITVNGDGDKETLMATMRMSYGEFKEFMEEYERDRRRKVF